MGEKLANSSAKYDTTTKLSSETHRFVLTFPAAVTITVTVWERVAVFIVVFPVFSIFDFLAFDTI